MYPRSAAYKIVSVVLLYSCVMHEALAAQCAVQFFATGLENNGKGVKLVSLIDNSNQEYIATFGPQEAEVLIPATEAGNGLEQKVDVTFFADYTDCVIEKLQLEFQGAVCEGAQCDNIKVGNCYTIEQTCAGVKSVYGTVFVDIWCLMENTLVDPGPFKVEYFQSLGGVDEVLRC